MDYFIGMVDAATGERQVVLVTAQPSLERVIDLTQGGRPADIFDWGAASSPIARQRLATLILSAALDRPAPFVAVDEFARVVLGEQMESGCLWIMERSMIVDMTERFIAQSKVVH